MTVKSLAFNTLLLVVIGISSGPLRAEQDPQSELKGPLQSVDLKSAPKSIFIGHNATPTTYSMRAHTITVGNYGVGYSPSDSLLIATSPWIWTSYKTANLVAKWTRPVGDRWRMGAFAGYFRSLDDGPLPADGVLNRYQFETAALQALASYEWSNAVVHAGFKYSYFVNDDRPYSLRMDPGDESIRGQLDLTFLIEQKIAEKMRLNLEFGSLALSGLQPYLHLGASWALLMDSWLLQLGASYTAQWGNIGRDNFWTPGYRDNRWKRTSNGQYTGTGYLVSALHPEVQVQYFF